MARDWESVLSTWAKPPSDTEQEKAANAERVIKKAIDAYAPLQRHSLSVFAQGSYRNRTNVREDSDVDICVLCPDTIMVDYHFAPGLTDAEAGLGDAKYQYAEYRNDVQRALISYLGSQGVTRGKKAFDVHANTYRLDADVVACFEYRQYHRSADGRVSYAPGTGFVPDGGFRIHNWPQQNYDNGVRKNDESGHFYKSCVRIFKRLRNEMTESGHAAAAATPSFLLESMLFNLNPQAFQEPTWTSTLRSLLTDLDQALSSPEAAGAMVEVNDLKYLFRGGQPWTIDSARAFILEAWQYHYSI